MYQNATKFVLLNFSTQYKKLPYVNNHIIHQLVMCMIQILWGLEHVKIVRTPSYIRENKKKMTEIFL